MKILVGFSGAEVIIIIIIGDKDLLQFTLDRDHLSLTDHYIQLTYFIQSLTCYFMGHKDFLSLASFLHGGLYLSAQP